MKAERLTVLPGGRVTGAPARQASTWSTFTWWDDAVTYAHRAAARTGRRHQVTRLFDRRWIVREVGS